MNTNTRSESSTLDTAAASHTEVAAARLEELRAMRQVLPHFVIPTDAGATRRLNNTASIAPEFVTLTTVVAKKTEAFGVGGPDVARMRERMDFADAYGPVAEEFEAIGQLLRHSIAAALNEAGSAALIIYEVTKRLAKLPETAELAPHVADMQRALGIRARNMRAKAAAAKRKEELIRILAENAKAAPSNDATPAGTPAVTPATKPQQ
jgi:hypothetical protein